MNILMRGLYLFVAAGTFFISLQANPVSTASEENALVLYCGDEAQAVVKHQQKPSSVQEIVAVLEGLNRIENKADVIAKAVRQAGYDMTQPLVRLMNEVADKFNNDPVFAQLAEMFNTQDLIKFFMTPAGISIVRNACLFLGDFYGQVAGFYYGCAYAADIAKVQELNDQLEENVLLAFEQAKQLARALGVALVDYYNIDKTLVVALQDVIEEKAASLLKEMAQHFVDGINAALATVGPDKVKDSQEDSSDYVTVTAIVSFGQEGMDK